MTQHVLNAWIAQNPRWQPVIAAVRQERLVYVVGGTVRDILLGRPSCDLDLATECGAMSLARRLADALGGAYVPLDAERDVARVVLSGGEEQRYVDVAALRAQGIEADLRARDLTINAMAWPLTPSGPGPLLDPLGGREDLRAHVLRAASPQAFGDDPLRILRVARIRGALGFRVEEQTEALMHAAAPGLRRISPERLRDELLHILALDDAADALAYALGFGVGPYLAPGDGGGTLPALAALARWESWFGPLYDAESPVAMPPDVHQAVAPYAHELAAYWREELVGGRPRWWLSKLAAWWVADQDASARASGFGMGLQLGTKELRHLEGAVRAAQERWPRLAELPSRPLALYRYYRQAGAAGVDGALLSLVQPAAPAERTSRSQAVAQQLEAWFARYDQAVDPPPLLTGHEIMAALGLRPGPAVGEQVEQLREAQVQGLASTPQEALAYLHRLAQRGSFPHTG